MTRILILSFGLFLSQIAFGQSSDDLLGTWLTQKGKSKVEIFKASDGKTYAGKVIWLKEPMENGEPRRDEAGNLVLGMSILYDFVFDDDEWTDGTIYDPESGNTYYCTLTMEGENKLKIRGSIDPMGWLGRTEYWERILD